MHFDLGIKTKEINKNAKLYLCALVFFYTSLGAFNMLQGIYIKELNISEDFLGLLISTKTMAIALSAFPCALLAKCLGKKRLILLSMILVSLFTILQGYSMNRWAMLVFGILQGIANALLVVCEAPFLMENSKGDSRIRLFSLAYAVNTFSVMLGYYIFGKTADTLAVNLGIVYAYRLSIIIAGILGLGSAIFIIMIRETNENIEHLKFESIISSLGIIRKSGVKEFLIFNSIIGFGAGLVVPYFNVFLKYKINITTNQLGIIMSLSQLGMGLGGLITPLLAKRFGKVKTINICQIASIPFLLIIATPPSIIIVSIAFFMRSALMNMAGPVVTNISMELVDRDKRPVFSSLMNLSSNLSRALSAAAAGVIMKNCGYETPYFITALLYIIATVYFHHNFKNFSIKHYSSKGVQA